MEIRQLRYFVAVAQNLSFSEAARRLFVTQGTLSQQIRQLEDELGSVLFERSSHSVSLTEAGMYLLPLAEDVLRSSKACFTKMLDLRASATGVLCVGSTRSFKNVVTPALTSFVKNYPGVKLFFHYRTAPELLELLRSREIDFALTFMPEECYDDMESIPLWHTCLTAAMKRNHPLAGCKSLSFGDISRYGVILPGRSSFAEGSFASYMGVDMAQLDIRMETNDPELTMDILENTNCVSFVSDIASCSRKDIVTIPIDEGSYAKTGCVLRLKGDYRKKSSEALVSLLKEAAELARYRF